MNCWVSYLLILSMLRLQLVFCGCGAIDHFELNGNDLRPKSSSQSDCPCGHHQTPVRGGNANHQEKVIRGECQSQSFSPICNEGIGRETHTPNHRHSHRYQPKTRAEPRLDCNWFEPFAGYSTPISASSRFLVSRQCQGEGVAIWLVFQTLVALLRI